MTMTRPLALRFLSGRSQGALVPVEPPRAMVVGRQPGADLVVTEELVSRRHARFFFEGDELHVEDLGSTNGTWVNGQRITRARVGEGDRVLMGGCLMKVVPRDGSTEPTAPTAEPRRASAMQGRLEEVPLPDLLQLFATSRKSGVLAVHGEGHEAQIVLERGRVTSCVIDGRTEHGAEKSFYRLLSWTAGTFELEPAPASAQAEATTTLGASLEALLMEGMRQLDELRRLRSILPVRFAPGAAPPADLEAEDGAMLALARRLGAREAVLDATALTDLAAAERLAKLVQRGLLKAA
jgi:hypothetical protein